MTQTVSQHLKNRKISVDILATLFGLGAWIGINGIYSQLPQLVFTAPEQWNLASHIVIVVQFANLGPILYTLYTKYSPWTRDHYIIYALLTSATIGTFYLSFNYKNISTIFNTQHSTSLMTIVFICAFVGCTSSVLFIPYMRNFREIYIVSCLVGEGLSGLLPNLIALIQGAGGDPWCNNSTLLNDTKLKYEVLRSQPRFTTDTFLIINSILLLMSLMSFIGLNKLKIAKCERVKPQDTTDTRPTDTTPPSSYITNSQWNLSNNNYILLMIMTGIVCFLGHSTLPSIQTYACLPYGNVAYHLSVTLASMAVPLSMGMGFIQKQSKTPKILAILTCLLVFVSIIIIYVATQSPNPPFQHTIFGTIFIVTLWFIVNGLIGYIKMNITTTFRSHPGKGLYHVGVATQVGSVIGAVLTLTAMSRPGLFNEYNPCDIFIKN